MVGGSFAGVIQNGYVMGRGAMDFKGGLESLPKRL